MAKLTTDTIWTFIPVAGPFNHPVLHMFCEAQLTEGRMFERDGFPAELFKSPKAFQVAPTARKVHDESFPPLLNFCVPAGVHDSRGSYVRRRPQKPCVRWQPDLACVSLFAGFKWLLWPRLVAQLFIRRQSSTFQRLSPFQPGLCLSWPRLVAPLLYGRIQTSTLHRLSLFQPGFSAIHLQCSTRRDWIVVVSVEVL